MTVKELIDELMQYMPGGADDLVALLDRDECLHIIDPQTVDLLEDVTKRRELYYGGRVHVVIMHETRSKNPPCPECGGPQ